MIDTARFDAVVERVKEARAELARLEARVILEAQRVIDESAAAARRAWKIREAELGSRDVDR